MVDATATWSEAALARVVAGRASPAERAAVMAAVREDPLAQKTFRTLVEAERALAGGPLDVPTAAELDALLPSVLPSVLPSSVPSVSAAPRRVWLPAALAAAAALAFAFIPRGGSVDEARDGEFRARGAGDDNSGAGESSLTVFCVVEGAAPRALGDACAAGASIVVQLRAGVAGAAALVLVDAAGARVSTARAAIEPSGVVPVSLDIPPSAARGRARLEVVRDDPDAAEPKTIALAFDITDHDGGGR